MISLGIASLGHDAAVALVDPTGEILFAGHAERYSRIKNDGVINESLLDDAFHYGKPDEIVWYESPLRKAVRWARAGQWSEFSTPSVRAHLRQFDLDNLPLRVVGHHESHAAAGYFTSGFDQAAILVCDAIGEYSTISVWTGQGNNLKQVWSQGYPHSLGLLYSAFTQRIGLKPNEEEYILMGMAGYGSPIHVEAIDRELIANRRAPDFRLLKNVHRGILDWRPEYEDVANIAASIQQITEEYLCELVQWVRAKTQMSNLVMMGGVALNCVANSRIATGRHFDNVWIMPNPGDAGSALGAIAAHRRQPLLWKTPYLGHDIPGTIDVAGAISALRNGDVIGIARGRAEYGPRALGNRSLICDPRGQDAKDRVNAIKHRDAFRPFAPVVLAEYADAYFDMPVPSSPYMQFTARVRRPDLFPAITHVDGTARVQTLDHNDNPEFHRLLREWHAMTGCPLLLNTSLNIKGEPLVNSAMDAKRFEAKYGIAIF